MDNILTVEGISKRFGRLQVLNDISFSVPTGRIVGLLGENGAGKTTLLRIIANILHADNGTVKINGVETSIKTNQSVSFLLESKNFYPWMKVKNAIQFYHDFYPDFDIEKALKLCSDYKLNLNSRITSLSKGNQERVCLLLNFSRNVRLYLLDEPVGGIDPKLKKEIIHTILANMSDSASVIISTHLLKDLEAVFDEIMILRNGRILLMPTDEIREKFHQSVEDFYLEAVEND